LLKKFIEMAKYGKIWQLNQKVRAKRVK
jgi:hypothetical protein